MEILLCSRTQDPCSGFEQAWVPHLLGWEYKLGVKLLGSIRQNYVQVFFQQLNTVLGKLKDVLGLVTLKWIWLAFQFN